VFVIVVLGLLDPIHEGSSLLKHQKYLPSDTSLHCIRLFKPSGTPLSNLKNHKSSSCISHITYGNKVSNFLCTETQLKAVMFGELTAQLPKKFCSFYGTPFPSSQIPATSSIFEANQVHNTPSVSTRSILISFSHILLGFLVVSTLQDN